MTTTWLLIAPPPSRIHSVTSRNGIQTRLYLRARLLPNYFGSLTEMEKGTWNIAVSSTRTEDGNWIRYYIVYTPDFNRMSATQWPAYEGMHWRR